MKDKKAAKKLLRLAKEHPDWYSKKDVFYAKQIKKQLKREKKQHERKLVTVTPKAEETMGYVARVSNPKNQDNPKVSWFVSHCIKHGHWSVFEQAHMTVEIETTEVLLHRY